MPRKPREPAAKVKDNMIRDVKTTSVNHTIYDAAETMNRYGIGSVIITEDDKPVGIVTERDILKRVIVKRKDPAKTKTVQIMSKPLVTASSNVTTAKATRLMIKHKVKKLPVTNSGRLVGILSLTDLIRVLRTQKPLDKLCLKGAPKRVKRVFDIYYDPIRQIRKNCPLTMLGGMAISCLASKCMWYVNDRCVILKLVERA